MCVFLYRFFCRDFSTQILSALIMNIREKIRKSKPKIHVISNNASLPFVVDSILALGAIPIAAISPMEVYEITEGVDALLLNTGTPDNTRIKSYFLSLEAAKKKAIPLVLDPVACFSTGLRRDFIKKILRSADRLVIRGNLREIYFLATGMILSEADKGQSDIDSYAKIFSDFSKETGFILAITGETDMAVSGERIEYINTGTPLLTKITGGGCMLSGVLTAALAADMDNSKTAEFDMTCEALKFYGDSALEAERKMKLSGHAGTETFRTFLIDELSEYYE